MLVNAGPLGGTSKKPPEYTYTGTKPEFHWEDKEKGNWRMVFPNDCKITFKTLNSAKSLDIMAVSGGHPGRGAYGDVSGQHPGPGGRGAEVKLFKDVKLPAGVPISVHIGGSDGASYISNYRASGDNYYGAQWEFGDSKTGRAYGYNGSDGFQLNNITQGLDGADGAFGTGNGGNGGRYVYSSGAWRYGNGGYGGVGVIIIRNAR